MARNLIALVYGMKGAGKTTLLRRWTAHAERLLVVDVTDDYAADDLEPVTSLRAAAQQMAARSWRLRLTADLTDAARESYLEDQEPGRLARLGPGAAWLAWAARSCVLVLDELAYWCNPSYTPGPIKLLASYGRHRGVSLLGTSRRPSEIGRNVSAMADVIVCYRTTEPRDLVYLRELFGPEVRRLPELRKFHGLLAGEPAALQLIGAPSIDTRLTPVSRLRATVHPHPPFRR